MRKVRIWRSDREGEMSQIAAVNALSDAYVTYDDYKRLAGDLVDAQTRIVELKQEIAEDAKATAESQEITGKYMADAESAQRLLLEVGLLLLEVGAKAAERSIADAAVEAAEKIRAAIRGQG